MLTIGVDLQSQNNIEIFPLTWRVLNKQASNILCLNIYLQIYLDSVVWYLSKTNVVGDALLYTVVCQSGVLYINLILCFGHCWVILR